MIHDALRSSMRAFVACLLAGLVDAVAVDSRLDHAASASRLAIGKSWLPVPLRN